MTQSIPLPRLIFSWICTLAGLAAACLLTASVSGQEAAEENVFRSTRIREPEPLPPARALSPKPIAPPVVEAEPLPEELQQRGRPSRGLRGVPREAPGPLALDGRQAGQDRVAHRPVASIALDMRPKVIERWNGGHAEGRVMENPSPTPDYFDEDFGALPVLEFAPPGEPDAILALDHAPAGSFPRRPLYFEEVNLERYGRSYGMAQPLVSGVRFFGSAANLPYLMTVYHPNECYDWHYPFPAGRSAPRVRERPPLSAPGAGVQAGAMAGLLWLIP